MTLTGFADNLTRPGPPPYLTVDFWPPPELLADQKMATAVTEVRDLIKRWREARAAADAARKGIDAAKDADQQARADAIRAGEPELAAKGAATDALAIFTERGPALAERIRKTEMAKSQRKLVAALDTAAEAAEELKHTGALFAHLTADALGSWQRYAVKFGGLPPVRLTRTSDQPTFADLLGALQIAAAGLMAEPAPEAEAAKVQPLHSHPMQGAY